MLNFLTFLKQFRFTVFQATLTVFIYFKCLDNFIVSISAYDWEGINNPFTYSITTITGNCFRKPGRAMGASSSLRRKARHNRAAFRVELIVLAIPKAP